MRLVLTRTRQLPAAFPIVYETPRASYFVAFVFFLLTICLAMIPSYLDSVSDAESWIPGWSWHVQMAILSMSAAFVCLVCLNRLHVVITETTVFYKVSGLIGRERWQRSLNAYAGVGERRMVAAELPEIADFKGFKLYIHILELRHASDTEKDVKLLVRYSRKASPAWDAQQAEAYCRLLKKPKLDRIAEPERLLDLLNLFSG